MLVCCLCIDLTRKPLLDLATTLWVRPSYIQVRSHKITTPHVHVQSKFQKRERHSLGIPMNSHQHVRQRRTATPHSGLDSAFTSLQIHTYHSDSSCGIVRLVSRPGRGQGRPQGRVVVCPHWQGAHGSWAMRRAISFFIRSSILRDSPG